MKEEEKFYEETFRDTITTVDKAGKWRWIYAIKPKGRWYNIRKVAAYLYFLLFVLVPFIKLDGNPLLMINILDSKFSILGKMFWPHDMFIFAILMIALIVFIVLFTIAFGRLFCGWACPQTIFLEFIFRPIEWLIEGSPSQQRKLDKAEWTIEKIIKKTSKHILYLLISFGIANIFLAYIIGIDELFVMVREPLLEHKKMLFGLIGFSILFYVVFAFVRDLICTTVCPYGRLQSVMVDKNTMQVAYDYSRGEPRARFKKNEIRTQGDCIDCFKCVMVCPTGIDIRNGTQMECVACTACIDECNTVMTAINKPKGLIRYASENELEGGEKIHFNARMKAYSMVLFLLVGLIAFLIVSRNSVDVFISKVKGQLYQENPDGTFSNLYELKIFNKNKSAAIIQLIPENYKNAWVKVIGQQVFNVDAEKMAEYKFFVMIPRDQVLKRSNDLTIGLYLNGKKFNTVKTKFSGPFN